MSQYAKAISAVVGLVVSWLVSHNYIDAIQADMMSGEIVSGIPAILAAYLVYRVPNRG